MQNKLIVAFFVKVLNIDYVVDFVFLVNKESPRPK
jgi:hypothetical protein